MMELEPWFQGVKFISIDQGQFANQLLCTENGLSSFSGGVDICILDHGCILQKCAVV